MYWKGGKGGSEGGLGRGFGWDPPPPRVPLWSLPKGRGAGKGVWLGPPSSQGPPMVPAENFEA